MASYKGNPERKGNKLCGAKTRNGTPCRAIAMANGRCRIHGGKSPVGIGSARYTTGRWSKYMPAHMMTRYQEAMEDEELLALRQDIAVLDARVMELFGHITTGESETGWEAAKEALVEVRVAISKQDPDLMSQALNALQEIIFKGSDDYKIWAEIQSTMEQRRRFIESERRRLLDMEQLITAERAVLFTGALLEIIKQHVTDRPTLAKIANDVSRLLNQDDGRRSDGGGKADVGREVFQSTRPGSVDTTALLDTGNELPDEVVSESGNSPARST